MHLFLFKVLSLMLLLLGMIFMIGYDRKRLSEMSIAVFIFVIFMFILIIRKINNK